ncbi:MAG TPA: ROK family protein [Anaerolineales bacterium]|nr:ROK family protein [Anaerolineales bacterium]HNN14295.1 ROK family protein [Anaerolineales bacterium]HNO30168.1 ROK family protein [Anaerolineales bacterium]
MKNTSPIYGAIEGGGTKFVCAVGSGPNNIRAEARFETTTPEETMSQVVEFFKQQEANTGKLAAIGFACFGPLDPNPDSPTYGYVLPTPKPGWTNANVVGMLRNAFEVPIAFDTDVNGAALGEWRWGKAQGLKTFIYLTVGTGVGGGAYVEGNLLHGLVHPEMGHIFIKHDTARDPFEGACPFHGDCFEGLASGVAIEKRWGQRGGTLPADHPAWDLEADYIAQALANYSLTLSPQRIIIGGGVGSLEHLLPRVQKRTREIINGYVQSPVILETIEAYIVNPGLGNRSGMLGAIALAEQSLKKRS